jgi:hypothetical protein
MMVVDNKFSFGQIVYLITDSEQKRRMVTKIYLSPNGVAYQLTCGVNESDHYEFEISDEVDVLAKTE